MAAPRRHWFSVKEKSYSGVQNIKNCYKFLKEHPDFANSKCNFCNHQCQNPEELKKHLLDSHGTEEQSAANFEKWIGVIDSYEDLPASSETGVKNSKMRKLEISDESVESDLSFSASDEEPRRGPKYSNNHQRKKSNMNINHLMIGMMYIISFIQQAKGKTRT